MKMHTSDPINCFQLIKNVSVSLILVDVGGCCCLIFNYLSKKKNRNNISNVNICRATFDLFLNEKRND